MITSTKSLQKILSLFSFVVLLALVPSACVNIPDNVQAVQNFDSEKYLGKWYEIARLDHRFERDLHEVTAEYSLKDNGNINVLNQGYNIKSNKWKSAEGRGKSVGSDTEGRLKVSFFGPFYSGYNIIELDDDYQHALVIGSETDYAWILAREPQISEEVKNRYVQRLASIGVNTAELIWVEHNVYAPEQ
ncbi:MAG: lipocalin family protein [Weeksellaceae bacterium]|nr:lipocalin family protein [Weeksellaceae bacterium]